MDYGYSRCSTNETKQDINRQVRELKQAGAEQIFVEYEHGDAKVKSQQAQMFAQAQTGDTIIVLEVHALPEAHSNSVRLSSVCGKSVCGW